MTPQYHHWHHARHAEYVDVNCAIHLPLVDMIMGTFRGRRPAPGRTNMASLMPLGTPKTFTDHVGAEGAPAVADR